MHFETGRDQRCTLVGIISLQIIDLARSSSLAERRISSPYFVHYFTTSTVDNASLQEVIGDVQSLFAALSKLTDHRLTAERFGALLDARFQHCLHRFRKINFHAVRQFVCHSAQAHLNRMRIASDSVLEFRQKLFAVLGIFKEPLNA